MKTNIQTAGVLVLLLWAGVRQGSPISARIAFVGEKQGNSGLYAMDLNGGNVTKVGEWGFFSPSWVPGGHQIVACIGDGHLTPSGIYLLDAQAKMPPILIAAGGTTPQCSPDGSKVVYETFRESPSQIRVTNLDGTTSAKLISGAGGFAPSWSPDSRQILYIDNPDSQNGGLWVMDEDGTNQKLRMRAKGGYAIAEPKWSPRGDKIVFTLFAPGALPDICVVNVAGGEPLNLTNSPKGWEGSPSWSPDGRRIIFSRSDEIDFGSADDGLDDGIWTMDEDGGNWVLLLSRSNPEISGGDDAVWWEPGLATVIQSLSWGQVKATSILNGRGLVVPTANPK